MQSFDDRPRGVFSPVSTQETGQVIPSTEPLTQDDSLAPLQAASDRTNFLSVQSPIFSPMVADRLTPLPPVSNVTRVLTGTLDGSGEATAQRAPVIIRGNMKKPVPPSQPPHPRRRKVTTMVGILVVFLVVSISLLTATPLGHTVGLNLTSSPLNNTMGIASNQNGNNTVNSIVAQATATAVYTDQQADGQGVGSGTVGGGTGGSGVVTGGNSSLAWPYGQCTYWANYEYHALAGWYVPWAGNADQWVAGANAAGWNVSIYPHVPSIMVLMPGVQGASYTYGHVAVVTSIINSSTVMTSNMNWYANYGGFGIVSNVEFNYGPGYGVYFVWHS
jgi:surface antigen